ncbi:UNVERIFIED_CONTAM: hypothetical protein K2H54_035667 [Gekko kuhli]
MEDDLGRGKLIKREFPQRYILTYSHIIDQPQQLFSHENKDYIKFSHTCPFAWVRIVGLPPPQHFTRKEHYRAEPPDIMEKTGFHDKKSLTVYQGLIFQLLWLHSAYNRPYADPVHDPTWRWWKNKMEDAQYYSYVASNRNSSGGVYVNMANYVKVYNIVASNALPQMIYLDKNSVYNFSVFFSIRTKEQSLRCLFSSPHPQGYRVLPVIIGCPPGRRLAFDITGTLQYSLKKNKRYFDCVNPDPEMPCFFFSDVFYPSFLIQDMVTGDSGPFKGSYIFQIIGGGPYLKKNIRYFSPDEILRYNANQVSETSGHIWLGDDIQGNQTDAEGFHILSGSGSGIMGVDETTYCDYALEFVIHVHGLRLSPTRAIFLMKAP